MINLKIEIYLFGESFVFYEKLKLQPLVSLVISTYINEEILPINQIRILFGFFKNLSCKT